MNELNKFGKIYINSVRDNTLYLLDAIINSKMKDEKSKSFSSELKQLPKNEIDLIKRFSTYLIDNALHFNLLMLEENQEIELILNGKNLIELSDGLCGELYTSDGWINKFSKY